MTKYNSIKKLKLKHQKFNKKFRKKKNEKKVRNTTQPI